MFSPAVVVPPQADRTVVRLLWYSAPSVASLTANEAGTLQDLYDRGLSPAATRCALVAEATADARSCRAVTDPDVAGGATAAGA